MKTLTAASVLFSLSLAGSALAQAPDPNYAPPQYGQPYAQPQQPYAPPQYGQPQYGQPQPYDPNQQPMQEVQPQEGMQDPYAAGGDGDGEIEGYDASYDVYYDNVAARGYDDGYDPNAYQQFEGALDQYGSWYDDPSYGHIWVPSAGSVGNDFSPYSTGGHWVLTEYGWTWVSDYSWGWAPFHYGRWSYVGAYGWSWIPGTCWGPGWVSWRSGGGYVGWSPLPPAGVRVGPPLGVRSPWRFTVAAQLGAAHLTYLPAHVVPSVFARTSVINNYRTANVGGATIRMNAGPTGTFVGAGVGVSTPGRLASIAPGAVPRANIVPRLGTSLQSRPWVQARVSGLDTHVSSARPTAGAPAGPRSIPLSSRPQSFQGPRPMQYQAARPSYIPPAHERPVYTSPRPYYAPVYSQPHYAPTYTSHPYTPAYSQPHYAPSYSAPSYAAPHYSAPSYSAPAQQYSAPSYSRPSYSAPAHNSAPAVHSSGGHFGGGHR
jgi:Family of unknown function (DUF6600)